MKRVAILALGTLMHGLPAMTPTAFAQAVADPAPVLAEVTFDVPGMTCALCPVTVKTAMSFDARTAHVVFDPALTDAATIASASGQAGYPATVQG
jgi:mercuric ion binding protein